MYCKYVCIVLNDEGFFLYKYHSWLFIYQSRANSEDSQEAERGTSLIDLMGLQTYTALKVIPEKLIPLTSDPFCQTKQNSHLQRLTVAPDDDCFVFSPHGL